MLRILKVHVINPGQTIQEVIPDTVRYSYTHFRSGIVLFPGNEAATALVNYNLMLGEMQFIDPKGDTLYIGDPEKFERIAVGLDTFFFNNGYLRQMAYKNKVRLLQKQTIRMAYVLHQEHLISQPRVLQHIQLIFRKYT